MTENNEHLENKSSKNSVKKAEKISQSENLKQELGAILLDVQEEYRKKGKILTADNAMDALSKRLSSSFKTKDLLEQLAGILKKPQITYEMIKDWKVNGSKSLHNVFISEYYNQLNNVNKRGTVSAYATQLRKSIPGFSKFAQSFPQFNKETKRRVVGGKEIKDGGLPDWDRDYFKELRNLVDEYLDEVHKKEPKKFDKVVKALETMNISIGSIVNHFVDIRLYDATTITKKTIIGGTGSRVLGTKVYSKKLKQMVDPRNLIDGLMGMQYVNEAAEAYQHAKKKTKDTKDYFSNKGGDINASLRQEYSTDLYKKSADFKKSNGGFSELLYYRWVVKEAKKRSDTQSAQLAEGMIWLLAGESALDKETVDSLKKVTMHTLAEQKTRLAKESGIYDQLIASLEQQYPKPSKESIERSIDNHKEFWNDFYDLSVTTHTLVDARGNEYQFEIDKNIVFAPGAKEHASSITELMSLELTYKPVLGPNGNYNMMAVMAREDVWNLNTSVPMHNAKEDIGYKQEIVLQKSQKYNLHGPQGEKFSGYIYVVPVNEPDGSTNWTIRLVDSYNNGLSIDELSGGYPFGLEGADSIKTLVAGWTFEPVNASGEAMNPEFKVSLPLGGESEQGIFTEHSNRLDKIALGMMRIHEDDLIDINNSVVEDFENKEFMKGFEDVTFSESEKNIRNRYLKAKVVTEMDIPPALIEKTPSDDIHAWIENGEIFLNNDHFKKTLGINLFDEQLDFINEKMELDMVRITERVNESIFDEEEYLKRRTVLLELRKLTVHEKAHRIFHYYGITDQETPTLITDKSTLDKVGSIVVHAYNDVNKEITLSNETLCEIAECFLFANEPEEVLQNIQIAYRYTQVESNGVLEDAVVIKGDDGQSYTVLARHIEQVIRQKDPLLRNFSFDKILSVDTAIIDDLVRSKDFNQKNRLNAFTGLLEARSERVDVSTIDQDLLRANGSNVYLYNDDPQDPLGARISQAQNSLRLPTDIDINALDRNSAVETVNEIRNALQTIEQSNQTGNIVLPTNPDGSSALGQDYDNIQNTQELQTMLEEDIDAIQEAHGPVPVVPVQNNQNNQRNNQNQNRQRPPSEEELEEQERQRIEASPDGQRRAFDREYQNLEGDGTMNGPPKKGDVLMVRDGSSSWPGGGSDWVKVVVDNEINNDTSVLRLKVSGHTEKTLGPHKGKIYEIPRTAAGIQGLKDNAKNEVYKYTSQSSQSDFFTYAKNIKLGGEWNKVSSGGVKEFKDTSLKTKKANVTHLASLPPQVGPYELPRVMYEVEWNGGSVSIKTTKDVAVDNEGKVKKQENIEQTMDYTMFIQFCRDKKLQPYTDVEVEKSKKYKRLKSKDAGDPQPHWTDKLMSIAGIIGAVKKFPETFKNKYEQEAKLQGNDLFNSMLNKLPDGLDGFLYLGDIKADAEAEKDAETMQIIDDYKSRLTRSDIGDGAHGGKGSGIIKKQIFDRKISKRSDRLKAAGYLLYAIENGGNPYQRKLQGLEGDGLWIKAILGEQYQADFIKEQNELIRLYKSQGIHDDLLQDRIAKLELHYIVNNTLDHPFFGSRYARKVEDHMDKRGKVDALDGVKQGIKSKGSFLEIYNAFRGGGIGNMLPHVFMGSMLAMEESIESKDDYEKFYQAVVIAMVSGVTVTYSKAYMDTFKGMCRRVGIPIGMFISDPNGVKKSTDVIDYIASRSGITPSLTDAIGETVQNSGDKRDPSKVTVNNYNGSGKQIKHVQLAVENRWASNGGTVINSFNFKDKALIEGLSDEKKPQAVEDYFGGDILFNSYKDFQERGGTKIDGDSPIYEGILNLAPGSFKSYMLDYRANGFQNEKTADMRVKFGGGISSFKTIVQQAKNEQRNNPQRANSLKPMMEVLLKKWNMYFGSELGEAGIKVMKKSLLNDDIDTTRNLLSATLFKENDYILEDKPGLPPRVKKQNNRYQNTNMSAPSQVKNPLRDYIELLHDGISSLSEADRDKIVNEILAKPL